MRRTIVVLLAFAVNALAANPSPQTPLPAERGEGARRAGEGPILGFNAQGAANERALETQYDAKLNRDNLRD